jgi:protocatechuate 3,4-dioxygenase beta subunit
MKKNQSQYLPIFRLSRRKFGFLAQGMLAAFLTACLGKETKSEQPARSSSKLISDNTAQNLACIVKPQQTEGPYFVEEKLNRSDIRADTTDKSVKPGTELRLMFQVSQVTNNSCKPLAGAIVDIWHCDAEGVYSGVLDRSFDTRGKNFLRGSQISDSNGIVQFVTIYPGWYDGRTAHIHFKIRTNSTSQKSYEFTSQLYFDDSLTDRVYAQNVYATRQKRTVRNDGDGIYQGGGPELTLRLKKDKDSYVGKFDLGLDIS